MVCGHSLLPQLAATDCCCVLLPIMVLSPMFLHTSLAQTSTILVSCMTAVARRRYTAWHEQQFAKRAGRVYIACESYSAGYTSASKSCISSCSLSVNSTLAFSATLTCTDTCRKTRRKRNAILFFAEGAVQWLNLVFWVAPNIYLLLNPCRFLGKPILWCGWVRWTCWNTVSLLLISFWTSAAYCCCCWHCIASHCWTVACRRVSLQW